LNGGLGQTYGRQGFQTSEQYYLHTVDLRPAEDQLLHGFHKTSIQQRIHRAEREGVEYESGRSGEFLAKFYPLMLRTRRRHQIPPPPMAWFRNLMECMGDALAIHIASYRNTAVASILTLRFRDTTFYKYAGSDPGYHKLGPMPFLLWRAIREAKANDIRIFDLGRSDSHQQGLVDFKDHWAGERKFVTYWRWPIRRKNFWMNDGAAFRVAGHFFELLPNSMLKAAGELLYRHIG
jgi:lipid II:glycine glycyltransferase (peptidoglycan interpeptide bridge formation enzyme)